MQLSEHSQKWNQEICRKAAYLIMKFKITHIIYITMQLSNCIFLSMHWRTNIHAYISISLHFCLHFYKMERLNIIALGTNLHFKPPPPQQYLQTKIMSSGSLIRSRVDFILSNGNHEISGQLNFSKKADLLIIIKFILPTLKDLFLNLSHHGILWR